jgi:hypothetical protein
MKRQPEEKREAAGWLAALPQAAPGRWFAIAASDLATIFPSLLLFATSDPGFMT